jgi:hypothetical protein
LSFLPHAAELLLHGRIIGQADHADLTPQFL